MFERILIANRGEIACRIAATCRRMGVGSVAVFSEADADAAHVAACDRAVAIGPAPPRQSYLHVPALIEAARRSGAQAVHPGYGFLSEDADFAAACAAAGLAFIGPPVGAMRAMAGKDSGRDVARRAGVAVLPGYDGADQSDARLAAEAAGLGGAVMIKAVAGGGGRGLRAVADMAGFPAALQAARREAPGQAVLLERWLPRARHIEVQVFADDHGGVVHLGARDCSLQRRHQKLVEEAPGFGVDAALRDALGRQAVALARGVGYRGAGTVEFIADVQDGLRAERIWFIEMNTRLQVEHPVTEAVTGLDLVEWQVRVAAGEALPLAQDEIGFAGHAVEARLCAENPARNFLPSPGRITRWEMPAGVRVDAGVRAGDVVTPFYDPLLAKLIAHADSRAAALARLAAALDAVRVDGIHTNAAFLAAALRRPEVIAGATDTGLLERERAAILAG